LEVVFEEVLVEELEEELAVLLFCTMLLVVAVKFFTALVVLELLTTSFGF
jgi:hypothetical protein